MRFYSLDISPGKISLYLVFLFFIALTFFSSEIPLFWDSAFYSQTALYYYENDFLSIIPPSDIEVSGSPLLSWMYLALMWKLCGKTLAISHWAFLPFLLGIVWEYYKLAKRFLGAQMIPWALLLLLLEPTFITQSIVMGYDIPKLYFYLMALNDLLGGKYRLYAISLCLLALCSMRGIIMSGSLFLLHFSLRIFFNKKKIDNELIWYLPVIFLATAWTWYHYNHTGWFFISPDKTIDPDRRIVFFTMMLRQSAYIFWQIVDFGRVFIWICIVFGFLYMKKKNKVTNKSFTLLLILLCPLLIFIIAFSPLSTSIGHRYFLILFLPSLVVACYILQEIVTNKKMFHILISVFCLGLITGNFWIYGGGFSNGWDSSLKTLPYFNLINEMRDYIKYEKINPAEVGTKFPMHQDIKYSDLSSESFHFTDIDTSSIDKFSYILLSNVSNQFTVHEKKILHNDWELQKEFHSGLVYLKLFKNREEIKR